MIGRKPDLHHSAPRSVARASPCGLVPRIESRNPPEPLTRGDSSRDVRDAFSR